jgi:ribosomal protein S18 acetylase RimI-like enzyme
MNKAEQSSPETDLCKRCIVRAFDPTCHLWDTIKDDITLIDELQFGDQSFSEEVLEYWITDPRCTTVFLIDTESEHIVGFTFAAPTMMVYEEYLPEYYKDDLHREADDTTAYIANTVIHPKYVGKHLVGRMMEELKRLLRAQGFTHIERDSVQENNYANNIRKNEQGNIEHEELHDSDYGPQIFFRIRLD